MSYKLNFLWPYEDGSLAEAAYEVANGRTFAYRKMWAGIFLQRVAQQGVQLTAATPLKTGAKSKAVKAVKSRRN